MTRLPENARSECVAPSVRPFGGVVESMRMFHAACAASQRPGFNPTRGSGFGAVAETIGATGGGITAGGGGGGGGGVPRPAGAGGAIVSGAAEGVAAGGAGATAGAAAAAGAAGAGAGAGAAAAAGGALGAAAGGDAFAVVVDFAHAGTPTAAAAIASAASRPLINHILVVLIGGSPAFRASCRSRSTDRRTRPTRTCKRSRPARRRTT